MADNTAFAEGPGNPAAGAAAATPTPMSLLNLTSPLEVTTASNTSHMATRAGFLGFFIVLSFLGNLTLVATVSQSRRLRGISLNMFVVSAACFNLVNCVVNMPLILGATIKDVWEYGDFVCRMNSTFLQFTKTGMLLCLACMALDRVAAVSQPAKYSDRMRRSRVNVLIVYSWIHSFIFSVAIWVPAENLSSRYYPHQYLCTLAEGSSLLYVTLESVFCFLLPFGFICAVQIYIITVCTRQKLKKKNTVSRQGLEFDHQNVWKEAVGAIYVGTLFIFWFVFEGPFIILHYINLYTQSKEIQDGVGSANLLMNYPWELDLAFTWMKLTYPVLLPIITFLWLKDIRKKFKNLVLCRKSNLINDSGPCLSEVIPSKPVPGKFNARNKKSPQEVTKQESYRKTEEHFNVPILFATSNGIHVSTYVKNDLEETFSDSEVFSSDILKSSKSSDFRMVKAKKVDVIGSQADMSYMHMDGDTSDYDSQMEMDPFSVSNPISVKSLDRQSPVNTGSRLKYLSGQIGNRDDPRYNNTILELTEEPVSTDKNNDNNFDSGIDYKGNLSKDIVGGENLNVLSSEENIECRRDEPRDGAGDDSGTGSVGEQWNQQNKAREYVNQRNKTEKVTVPVAFPPLADTKSDLVNDTKSQKDEVPVEPNEKKRKQKKKKKKNRSTENTPVKQGDANGEFAVNSNIQNASHSNTADIEPLSHTDFDEQAIYRRRPARLKPLEHKSHISVENPHLCTTKSLMPHTKLTDGHMVNFDQTAHENEKLESLPMDRQSIPTDSQGDIKHVKSDDGVFGAVSLKAGLQTFMDDTSSSRRHRRNNTVDSQTALLDSNSSTDLSEIRELNSQTKTCSEETDNNTISGDDPKLTKSKKHKKQQKSESKVQVLGDNTSSITSQYYGHHGH